MQRRTERWPERTSRQSTLVEQVLTGDQRTTLAAIAQDNGGLYRAYLLKEQLREIFAGRDLGTATVLLAGWISCARRCRLPAFVTLATTITRYRTLILNAVEHRLPNARSEATLNRITPSSNDLQSV